MLTCPNCGRESPDDFRKDSIASIAGTGINPRDAWLR
jgi:hypothetical protein